MSDQLFAWDLPSKKQRAKPTVETVDRVPGWGLLATVKDGPTWWHKIIQHPKLHEQLERDSSVYTACGKMGRMIVEHEPQITRCPKCLEAGR